MHAIQEFCTLDESTLCPRRFYQRVVNQEIHGSRQRFACLRSVARRGIPVGQSFDGIASAFERDHMAQLLERLVCVLPTLFEQLVAFQFDSCLLYTSYTKGVCALRVCVRGFFDLGFIESLLLRQNSSAGWRRKY